MINHFDTSENFWELYPDFKDALSFKRLYKSDKSRNKESSSRIMWYVAYTTDINSKYYKLPENEKHAIIGGDYMGDEQYYEKNKERIQPIIDDYIKINFTAAQRQLRDWEIKMDERAEFIKKMPYNIDTYEDLDKMAANTAKLFDTFKKIKEDISKEEGDGVGKGGAIASLND